MSSHGMNEAIIKSKFPNELSCKPINLQKTVN